MQQDDSRNDKGSYPRGAKVNIRITPSTGTPQDRRQRFETIGLPSHLVEIVERLREHEAAVMKWLAADDQHAAQFVLDPVKALRASGIPFGEGLLDTFDRERARRGAPQPPTKEASRIHSVSVTAKPKPQR